jgi:hypothetical protein
MGPGTGERMLCLGPTAAAGAAAEMNRCCECGGVATGGAAMRPHEA